MMRTLSSVASAVGGRLTGADAPFGDVSTDTRSLTPGALFVAIRGERFDGNDFVAEAHARGAAGALVSRLAGLPLPQIEAADTRVAFGRMAAAWRAGFSIPAVAVTGSAGKTTVKALIASILAVRHEVCVAQASLNNDIGVPLTLMRLNERHRALVAELGANHAGEIDYLARLVQPTVGVITMAGAAHLEGFGSLAGVAAAKGELLDHLPRAGTAVLNADDAFFDEWRARTRAGRVLSFGLSQGADCRLLGDPQLHAGGSRFRMLLPNDVQADVELPLLGRQNIANALAAAAAAYAAGAGAEEIRAGLARATAVRGRMQPLAGRRGAALIDDSYNANPTSARAAIDYLTGLEGRRIFVLGEMAELGEEAARLHREVGAYAAARCDQLIAVGEMARNAAEGFGSTARCAADADEAAALLEPELASRVTVLVKGSRVMRLERLVQALAAPANGGGLGGSGGENDTGGGRRDAAPRAEGQARC